MPPEDKQKSSEVKYLQDMQDPKSTDGNISSLSGSPISPISSRSSKHSARLKNVETELAQMKDMVAQVLTRLDDNFRATAKVDTDSVDLSTSSRSSKGKASSLTKSKRKLSKKKKKKSASRPPRASHGDDANSNSVSSRELSATVDSVSIIEPSAPKVSPKEGASPTIQMYIEDMASNFDKKNEHDFAKHLRESLSRVHTLANAIGDESVVSRLSVCATVGQKTDKSSHSPLPPMDSIFLNHLKSYKLDEPLRAKFIDCFTSRGLKPDIMFAFNELLTKLTDKKIKNVLTFLNLTPDTFALILSMKGHSLRPPTHEQPFTDQFSQQIFRSDASVCDSYRLGRDHAPLPSDVVRLMDALLFPFVERLRSDRSLLFSGDSFVLEAYNVLQSKIFDILTDIIKAVHQLNPSFEYLARFETSLNATASETLLGREPDYCVLPTLFSALTGSLSNASFVNPGVRSLERLLSGNLCVPISLLASNFSDLWKHDFQPGMHLHNSAVKFMSKCTDYEHLRVFLAHIARRQDPLTHSLTLQTLLDVSPKPFPDVHTINLFTTTVLQAYLFSDVRDSGFHFVKELSTMRFSTWSALLIHLSRHPDLPTTSGLALSPSASAFVTSSGSSSPSVTFQPPPATGRPKSVLKPKSDVHPDARPPPISDLSNDMQSIRDYFKNSQGIARLKNYRVDPEDFFQEINTSPPTSRINGTHVHIAIAMVRDLLAVNRNQTSKFIQRFGRCIGAVLHPSKRGNFDCDALSLGPYCSTIATAEVLQSRSRSSSLDGEHRGRRPAAGKGGNRGKRHGNRSSSHGVGKSPEPDGKGSGSHASSSPMRSTQVFTASSQPPQFYWMVGNAGGMSPYGGAPHYMPSSGGAAQMANYGGVACPPLWPGGAGMPGPGMMPYPYAGGFQQPPFQQPHQFPQLPPSDSPQSVAAAGTSDSGSDPTSGVAF